MAWICPPSSGQRIERSRDLNSPLIRGNHHGSFRKVADHYENPNVGSFDKGAMTPWAPVLSAHRLRRWDETADQGQPDHGALKHARLKPTVVVLRFPVSAR
jgi:hypothetical protein